MVESEVVKLCVCVPAASNTKNIEITKQNLLHLAIILAKLKNLLRSSHFSTSKRWMIRMETNGRGQVAKWIWFLERERTSGIHIDHRNDPSTAGSDIKLAKWKRAFFKSSPVMLVGEDGASCDDHEAVKICLFELKIPFSAPCLATKQKGMTIVDKVKYFLWRSRFHASLG